MAAWTLLTSARIGQSPVCRWYQNYWSVCWRSSWSGYLTAASHMLPRLQSARNSFLLLKVNNVPLIPSQLSFWNSASMNLVQSSQISSISLFLKEFFHRHSNKLLSNLFSKKPSLSTDDLNNFRPISNLNFISKILEKDVASLIQSHLSSNSLSSSFQSAYRIFHSTETTLLKIHNDLILAMDRGEVTSLILLDLSAAFDTVDHSILEGWSFSSSSKLVWSWWSFA